MQAYEDFPVGLKLSLGPYDVLRDAVLDFAREFDPQPFHLDDAAGEANMLGGLSASGWHSCAMMMRMMCDAFILDSTSQGSPGVDYIKWVRPVRPGDTLKGEMTVKAARLSAKRPTLGIATIENIMSNQNGETVLETQYALLLLTREGAGAR